MNFKSSYFEEDTRNHSLRVEHDDGLYRRLVFSKNGSAIYRFELVTWPGSLCIKGDMGTFVFSRVPDMFEFFRGGISTDYAAEKAMAVEKVDGMTKYSPGALRERVMQYFNDHWGDLDKPAEQAECYEQVTELLEESAEIEADAYRAVADFRYEYEDDSIGWLQGRFAFDDFFDGGACYEYTQQFLWCLDAIVWGIEQYDRQRYSPDATVWKMGAVLWTAGGEPADLDIVLRVAKRKRPRITVEWTTRCKEPFDIATTGDVQDVENGQIRMADGAIPLEQVRRVIAG